MDIRALNLEVVEVETKTRPGCLNSSSTKPALHLSASDHHAAGDGLIR